MTHDLNLMIKNAESGTWVPPRPKIVCLCGSVRFREEFEKWACFICGGGFKDDEKHPDNMHLICSKTIEEIDRIAHEKWVKKMKELGWKK